MKKTLKKFSEKKIQNLKAIKGGGFGSGTKKSTSSATSRAALP